MKRARLGNFGMNLTRVCISPAPRLLSPTLLDYSQETEIQIESVRDCKLWLSYLKVCITQDLSSAY